MMMSSSASEIKYSLLCSGKGKKRRKMKKIIKKMKKKHRENENEMRKMKTNIGYEKKRAK